MRQKYICLVSTLFALVMLASCTEISTPSLSPSMGPQPTPTSSVVIGSPFPAPHFDNQPSEAEIKDFCEVQVGDTPHYAFVTALIGEHTIMVNGDEKDIDALSFEQDGFYYLPAQAIAEYFGDYYSFSEIDSTATIWCPEHQNAAYYKIGEPRYTIWSLDADVWQKTWYHTAFIHGYPPADSAAPLLKDGVVYLPAGFFLASRVEWLEASSAVILTHSEAFDFIPSLTFAPGSLFSMVPEDLKQSLVQTTDGKEWPGETAAPNPVLYNRYENNDIQIDTTYWNPAIRPNEPDLGVEYVRSITLLSDKYATARGLRFGDSGARFELLYGYPIAQTDDGSYRSMGDRYSHYVVSEGVVSFISFSSRLDQVALRLDSQTE